MFHVVGIDGRQNILVGIVQINDRVDPASGTLRQQAGTVMSEPPDLFGDLQSASNGELGRCRSCRRKRWTGTE